MKAGAYLKSVRSTLPEVQQACLDAAFAGDAVAARRLMIIAPRRVHGHLACLAYQLRVENPACREIIKAAWAEESRTLLTLFWPPQMVRRMLEAAEFPVPAFSAPVTVYRAVGRGTPKRKAAAGLCWYLSRGAAAAAAAGGADYRGERFLRAAVTQKEIIYWGNGVGEQEIVSRRPLPAMMDETPALHVARS